MTNILGSKFQFMDLIVNGRMPFITAIFYFLFLYKMH